MQTSRRSGVKTLCLASILQDEEAEMWYHEALRLSPLEERDASLSNLALLLRANGSRLEEAVDLIAL